MAFSRWVLRHPYLIAVFGLAIIVVGVRVVSLLPVDLLPTFTTPAVQVLTFYPGMPAEVVEQDISTRLERWTGQANGVARQESKSMVGVSVVKDFFRPDIDPNTALSMVSALAISDLYYLPPGTIPPMVMPFDPTATIPLALVTVSSPTADETKLYDVAYFELRNRLQAITGVIAPAVYGGKLRRILAYVDPLKLQSRGLSALDVIEGIRKYNVLVPTGSARFGDIEYQINTNGMVDEVPRFDDIPLKVTEQGPVFVGDVAATKDAAAIQTNIVRIDGRRQVYIPIYRQPGANTLAIVDGIKAQLGQIQKRLPKDIRLDVAMDQSVYVRNSIHHLQWEAVVGAVLAALMILIFLQNVRATLVMALALPVALIAGFVGLFLLDQSINAMTLGGMALAIGLLIDQSIVVIENIERHLEEGQSVWKAALAGVSEMTGPLVIITITIVAVFFPIVFLTGMSKFLFAPLGLAVSLALLGSLVTSLTIVPTLCRILLRTRRDGNPEEGPGWAASLTGRFNRWIRALQEGYERAAAWSLGHRGLVGIGAGGLLLVSLALSPLLGQEFFPSVDAGQITLRVRGPSGLRLERTEDLVSRVEREIKNVIPEGEINQIISNIGVLLDWPAAYTPNSGPMDAFINIQLTDERTQSSQAYAERLRAHLTRKFPGAEFAFDTGSIVTAALNGGLPAPINIQIEGKSLATLAGLAEEVRRRASAVPGAVDVRVQQRMDYPEIRVQIDREKAAYFGLTQEGAVKNVVAALNSSTNFAPTFWIDHGNGNHYFLGVQYREEEIESLDTLKDILISGPGAKRPIPLRDIATFERASAPTEVNHLNITRVFDLYANVQGRDVGSVAADIEEALSGMEVPPTYFVHMRGEVQSMREAFGAMGGGLLLAVALVYLVLVVQFRSFAEPFIVLSAAPLGLVGVVPVLLLTGTTVNIQSLMGLIMMVGITVSYSVLYIDYANRRVAQGMGIYDAIREAARVRFRPILMTSLAAILGMLPIALSPGQAITPLAITAASGLAVSTALMLLVVPTLYTAIKKEPKELSQDAREALAIPALEGIS